MSADYISIVVINLSILFLFSLAVIKNTILEKLQRGFFLNTIMLLGLISTMEFFTILLDNSPVKYRIYHILANFIGFGLTPLVPYYFSRSIMPLKRSRFFEHTYLLFVFSLLITTIIGKYSIFYIDENNSYSRDIGFYFYLFVLVLSYVVFIWQNFVLAKEYLFNRYPMLILSSIFVLGGAITQIFLPQVHSTWICTTLGLIIYYIHNLDFFGQADIQTELLNYSCFLTKINGQKNGTLLVMIVLDNFKKYQENYTRTATDKILVKISNHIKTFYLPFGDCFRLGTDEFCVIIKRPEINIQELNKTFFKELSLESMEFEELPLISIGVAEYNKEKDLNELFSEADKDRRKFAKNRINLFYN